MLRAILLPLALGAALAGSLSHADLKADYGPDAPPVVVSRLQDRLSSDPASLYRALPAAFKAKGFSISVANTPRGVDVQVQVEGTAGDAKEAAEAIAGPLTDLAQEAGGEYAEQTTVRGEAFRWPHWPTIELPHLGLPDLTKAAPAGGPSWLIQTIAGLVAAFGLAAMLVAFLRRQVRPAGRKTPQATFWGSPVLGLLPESLARVGKLYHLQSKPCQALAYYFGQRARNRREVILCGPTPEASGTVAVCLGLFLAREGEKVLLVDMSKESPVIPAILARFGPPPDTGDGAAETGIPDLDLWVAPSPDGRLPTLPPDLARPYVRILYISPPGLRSRGAPVVEILSKSSFWHGLRAALGGNRLGWVFFGDSVPMRVSDRYYTRYYYERLHDVSGVAAIPADDFVEIQAAPLDAGSPDVT